MPTLGEEATMQEIRMKLKIDDNEGLTSQIARHPIFTREVQLKLQEAMISSRKQIIELLIETSAFIDAKTN